MKWKSGVKWLGVLIVISGLAYIGASVLFPKEPSLLQSSVTQQKQTKRLRQAKQKTSLQYVALGDSLTEGVGDETKQGGFVSILADSLKDHYHLTSIHAENAGVAGERSDQILNRVNKETDLQEALKKADFITMTFGGNDLVKVIQRNLLALSVDKFTASQTAYQQSVEALVKRVRALNSHAPIYVLGIYNPFYLNFSEIKQMQTIVDNWNDATKEIVLAQKNMYFIPINDLLYKGIDNQVGITEATKTSTTETTTTQSSEQIKNSQAIQQVIENSALYQGDKFHPNRIGYQIMAKAVREKMMETNQTWLRKE